jgi:hypothetical protein
MATREERKKLKGDVSHEINHIKHDILNLCHRLLDGGMTTAERELSAIAGRLESFQHRRLS